MEKSQYDQRGSEGDVNVEVTRPPDIRQRETGHGYRYRIPDDGYRVPGTGFYPLQYPYHHRVTRYRFPLPLSVFGFRFPVSVFLLPVSVTDGGLPSIGTHQP